MLAALPAGIAAAGAGGGAAAGGSALSGLGGPLIGAGGSLLGGLIGGSDAKKAVKKQWKYQKEFQKNKMQWAVQDAKAAGLHPLFALGAGGGGGSPSFSIPGQSAMGSAIGDAAAQIGQGVAARPSEMAKQLQRAQIESINSQTRRNDAEAALALSQFRRFQQEANVSPSVAAALVDAVDANRTMTGKTRVVPSEQLTRARGDQARTASNRPMWQKWQWGPRPDQVMDIPWSEEGPFEEFGPAKAIATLIRAMQNRAKRAPLPRRPSRKQSRRGRTQRLRR